jgi:hypothetical protein
MTKKPSGQDSFCSKARRTIIRIFCAKVVLAIHGKKVYNWKAETEYTVAICDIIGGFLWIFVIPQIREILNVTLRKRPERNS